MIRDRRSVRSKDTGELTGDGPHRTGRKRLGFWGRACGERDRRVGLVIRSGKLGVRPVIVYIGAVSRTRPRWILVSGSVNLYRPTESKPVLNIGWDRMLRLVQEH